jgi:hypothetical protein
MLLPETPLPYVRCLDPPLPKCQGRRADESGKPWGKTPRSMRLYRSLDPRPGLAVLGLRQRAPCRPRVARGNHSARLGRRRLAALRRRILPALANSAQRSINDLAAFGASRRGPTTAALLQILLQRTGRRIKRGVGLESTAGADRRRSDGSPPPPHPGSPDAARDSRGGWSPPE